MAIESKSRFVALGYAGFMISGFEVAGLIIDRILGTLYTGMVDPT